MKESYNDRINLIAEIAYASSEAIRMFKDLKKNDPKYKKCRATEALIDDLEDINKKANAAFGAYNVLHLLNQTPEEKKLMEEEMKRKTYIKQADENDGGGWK